MNSQYLLNFLARAEMIVQVWVPLKFMRWDLPGGPVAKSSPASTGDADSIPHPGRFHMPQSDCWAFAPEPMLHNKGSQAPQPERSSCSPQLEKAHAAVKTQRSQKQIIKKQLFKFMRHIQTSRSVYEASDQVTQWEALHPLPHNVAEENCSEKPRNEQENGCHLVAS